MESLFQSVLNPQFPQIIAVGQNYLKHVIEMGGTDIPQEPVIFMKPHSSLILPGQPYFLPKYQCTVHHETELGFMIGKQGKNIKAEDWKEYVGGYFLGLDLTDRDRQTYFKKVGFPWDIAKGADGFFPISKFVPVEQVVDPLNLELHLVINGKTIQQDITGNMHFKIPALIQYISTYMTLNEGDLVLTGTPNGIGPIVLGDEVEAYLKQKQSVLADIKFKVQ